MSSYTHVILNAVKDLLLISAEKSRSFTSFRMTWVSDDMIGY